MKLLSCLLQLVDPNQLATDASMGLPADADGLHVVTRDRAVHFDLSAGDVSERHYTGRARRV